LSFLAKYFDLFKQKSSDLKNTLSVTIVSILQPLLLEKHAQGVDYTEWNKVSLTRYNQFVKKLKTRAPKVPFPSNLLSSLPLH